MKKNYDLKINLTSKSIEIIFTSNILFKRILFNYIQLKNINFALMNFVIKGVEDDARHTDVLRNTRLRNAQLYFENTFEYSILVFNEICKMTEKQLSVP